jgi:scyllo-inositol 2-dehydrogenase (NADP+)
MGSADRKLKVAAVGLGWVTTHRHLPAMRRCSQIEVVGVADRSRGLAQSVAGRYGLRRFSEAADLEEIPWLDEVDAVTFGTPVFSHYDLIRQALARGRHVLTEKPFTLSVEEGESLAELARQAGRVLAVVHNFQFCRSARRLVADLRDGRLGTVRSVIGWQTGNPRRRLPEWYEELPLGLFYDESPHLFYLLRRFAPGPLRLVSCTVLPSTLGKVTPSTINAQYVTPSAAGGVDIPVNLLLNFESPVSEWHLAVLGDQAAVDLDIFRDIYIRLPNDGRHDAWRVFRTSATAAIQHFGQHLTRGLGHVTGRLLYGNQEVFRRFAEAAQSGTEPEDIGVADALAVVRMQHEVLSHAPVGRKPSPSLEPSSSKAPGAAASRAGVGSGSR